MAGSSRERGSFHETLIVYGCARAQLGLVFVNIYECLCSVPREFRVFWSSSFFREHEAVEGSVRDLTFLLFISLLCQLL